MPVIRIDPDVYNWLQKHAKPFEDTPNSVLRRIAKLAPIAGETSSVSNSSKGTSGADLNQKWGVGAKHALYHAQGTWYENLSRFPGALFDPNGYILFKTEKSYRESPALRIGKKTNVARGISSLPGYVRMT